MLLYIPYVKHLLVPLEYTFNLTGHLPAYLDGFGIPPSFYHSFLPPPQIIYLNLAPFATPTLASLRLAHDHGDLTVASGARVLAKRYLHVAGFEITNGPGIAPEWAGLVTLEAEGTAEGRAEMERRLNGGTDLRPWEVVRDKSMQGTVWLRVVDSVKAGM